MSPFDLSTEDWRSLVRGVARGQYNLLLGAGASVGVLGGDGRLLPTAIELARQLSEDFQLRSTDLDLREAYELVENKRTRNGTTRNEYFRQRFSNCTPTWHSLLTTVRWKRIWSLNIDDVIQQVYAQEFVGSKRQPLKPFTWRSPFRDPRSESDELQLIQLHGTSSGEGSDQSLVFSIVEYLSAASAGHSWHRIFGDLFASQPFIVVGARLVDEFDLADILRRGNSSESTQGLPSVVVLKEVADDRRDLIASWGLKVLTASGEEVMQRLASESLAEEKSITELLPPKTTEAVGRDTRLFIDQFKWMRVDASPDKLDRKRHDFYAGSEPLWSDILSEMDAPFSIVNIALENIERFSVETQTFHLIVGPRGSGKSTSLLRIGRELISKGYDVFLFRSEERLDVRALLWWLNQRKRSVILFDGVSDFAGDIARALKEAAALKLGVVMIGTERDSRTNLVFQEIPAQFMVTDQAYRLDRLNEPDCIRLLNKLSSERRLGRITKLNDGQRRDYFLKESGGQLLVGMLGLEGGGAFASRIRDEFLHDVGPNFRSLYGIVCMSHSFGYSLPLGPAAVASGISVRKVVNACDGDSQLAGILKLQRSGLSSRHRVIASLVIEHGIAAKERFELSTALVKALAPYITLSTIRSRTLHFRIVRSIMDERVVDDWVGRGRLSEWYEGIRREYEWTSRYWEQRALAESRYGNFGRARSFAEHAVGLDHHSFSLNTLGTVLMRMAVESARHGLSAGDDLFWDAIKALSEANRLGNYALQHPFVTFFSYSLRIAQIGKEQGGNRSQELLDEWGRWMRRAERSPFFQHPEKGDELKEFQRRWLQLTVPGSGSSFEDWR